MAAGRRTPQRGQSIVELCLVLPLLITLMLGVWTTATFLYDRQTAGQAARAGARLGAELGNNGYTASATVTGCQKTTASPPGTGLATDPCTVDSQIISSVAATASSLVDSVGVSEVDIFKPCNTSSCSGTGSDSGVCSTSTTGEAVSYATGDPVDVYKPVSGTLQRTGTPGYTLDMRSQTHPTENVIGVRVVYAFKAPDPMTLFNFTTSESAVMCLAPKETV